MDWKNLKFLGAGAAIAAATVLAGGSPAWAAGAGVTTGGSSTISGDADPTFPLCLPATGASITLLNLGTFNGSVTPVATTAKFTASAGFFFGPTGTFSNPMCTTPVAVAGSLTVTGGGGCSIEDPDASYQRVTNAYVIQGTSDSCGTLVYTGNQSPCLPLPVNSCGPNGQQEFTGTYTQIP